MKHRLFGKSCVLVCALVAGMGSLIVHAPAAESNTGPEHSGNPIFPGWYADPEAKVFGKEYWVYPTYSAPYNEQTLFDAFSSPDLVHWTKHSAHVRHQRNRLGAPRDVGAGGRGKQRALLFLFCGE